MLDTIERTNTTDELQIESAATKRERIESELRHDAGRSDREIARVVGVDHKTVAKCRGKTVPTASPAVSSWKPSPPEKPPEFDPFNKDGEDLVVKHQPAIAIYLNPWDAVVIRQRNDGDDDPCVFICEEHLPAVISKLSELMGDLQRSRRT